MGETDEDGEDGDPFCKTCKNEVKHNEQGLLCEGKCQSWYHIACVGISSQQYKKMNGEILKILIWMCPSCKEQLKQLMQIESFGNKMKTLCEKFTSIEEKVKIRFFIHKLYILRNVMAKKLLLMIYKALVELLLRYGIVVWGVMYSSNLTQLKVVQY
ncbi:unnamed protein product [Psylliodes chrysocephalus]|uniref:PHD-type domain-containing protein n=1 Tax=Psylliodes chrysocephalus TaxID=3402493 RepID=A0A9P0D5T7_9CUCU|nr:unnamed protein product [Psylliodes chrysocephala]